MRPVDSFTSDNRLEIAKVLATHSNPAPSASSPTAAAARSHQAISTPAAASGGAIVQARSTPCLLSHEASASSRSRTVQSVQVGDRRPLLLAEGVQGCELFG